MSLIYIPPNFQFTQIRLPVFGKTPWGLDTASVVWAGPAPKLDAFLKSLKQGSTLPACTGFHPAYGKMFLTSWTDTDATDFPIVTLSYVGTLNGALPDPLIYDDFSSGAGSQTAGDDGDAEDQRTWSITFYSPTRRFRYITDARPKSPKFNDYSGGPLPFPVIRSSVIVDGNGRYRSSSAGASWTPAAVLQSFPVSPIEGTPFFECEENWVGSYLEI